MISSNHSRLAYLVLMGGSEREPGYTGLLFLSSGFSSWIIWLKKQVRLEQAGVVSKIKRHYWFCLQLLLAFDYYCLFLLPDLR